MMNRLIIALLCAMSLQMGHAMSQSERLNAVADSLDRNLKEWKVPQRRIAITSCGAMGNGKTICTKAIQRALDRCSQQGGGTVVVPFKGKGKSDYVTGTIELRANVMLEVEKGARLLGSTSLADYPDKVEQMKSVMSEKHRYRISLIYAERIQNTGICGEGEIYFRGERENFPGPETSTAIEGRPFGIRMIECRNVVVRDIYLHNSAAWMQSYLCCEDLIFDGMKVMNNANYNNDGLDPDGCRNIIVRNCMICSEDDAFVMKGASQKPTENILVENSTFLTLCNAFKIGTDTQGDFSNIIARNLTLGGIPDSIKDMHHPPYRDYECSTGITLETVDGGDVHDILIENVSISRARCPIFMYIGCRGRIWAEPRVNAEGKLRMPNPPGPGRLYGITIDGVSGYDNKQQGSLIMGQENRQIENVAVRNVSLSLSQAPDADREGIFPEPPVAVDYPDAQNFGLEGSPAYGFYIRDVSSIQLENIDITPAEGDTRQMIVVGKVYKGGNPIIRKQYSADPSARVFGDTLYLYPSHDRDGSQTFDMEDYHVYTTTDMKTFHDRGVCFDALKQTSWATFGAWAPDCIERKGNYYLYYPTDKRHIGVAVSKSPLGPFHDAIGKPLISIDSPGVVCNRDFIDPCVFVDDDNQAYLFMGQNTVCAIRLNEDMVSYDGNVFIVDGCKEFFEAIWMHKYNGKYYLSYSNGSQNGHNPQIAYAVADSPLGPYRYQGIILDEVNSGTNHHSIVEYKGQWYLFYHTSDLYLSRNPQAGKEKGLRRSVCMTPLYYNPDGTIQRCLPAEIKNR